MAVLTDPGSEINTQGGSVVILLPGRNVQSSLFWSKAGVLGPALLPSPCLTLLPQSVSLPLQTVLNSFSFELCFPLQALCLTPGCSGTVCSFHPCLCLILQHLIQGPSLLECLSWCYHCKPSSHLPNIVFSFSFSMPFYFRGCIQHLLFRLGQLSCLWYICAFSLLPASYCTQPSPLALCHKNPQTCLGSVSGHGTY